MLCLLILTFFFRGFHRRDSAMIMHSSSSSSFGYGWANWHRISGDAWAWLTQSILSSLSGFWSVQATGSWCQSEEATASSHTDCSLASSFFQGLCTHSVPQLKWQLMKWVPTSEQEILATIIRLISLIRDGPNRERCVWEFFCCCMCIRCNSNVFTVLLSSNDSGLYIQTHTHTHWWEGFMRYAVEMGLGAMTYIASFIKIGLGIQKLIGVIHRHTDSMVIS
jgi:hypothetical protein